MDEVSNLHLASSKLLGVFDNQDPGTIINLHNQLQIPGSLEGRRLEKLLGKFEEVRNVFGTSGYLINQSIVIQVLRQVNSWSEVGNGLWRPDCIIQLANLAEIVSVIFPQHREAQTVLDPLAHLQHNFPSPFMNQINPNATYAQLPGNSKLWTDTFEVALELRTQYVIKLLIEHENEASFDPDDITRLMFYSDDDHFRGWDIEGFQDEEGNATKNFEPMIKARVEALREQFTPNAEDSVDFISLNEAFPWMDCLIKLCQWAHLRAQELKDEIQARGGADRIEELLLKGAATDPLPTEEFVKPLPVSRISEQMTRRLQSPAAIEEASVHQYVSIVYDLDIFLTAYRTKRTSLDNAYRLRELENAASEAPRTSQGPGGQYATANAIPPATATVQSPDDGVVPFGDDATVVATQASVASPRKTQLLQAQLSKLRRESNKENVNAGPSRRQAQAFIDRQAGARRIDFDSQDLEPESRPIGKRPAPPVDDEDDDFEEDARPHQRPRRGTPRQSQNRSNTLEGSDHAAAGTGLGAEDEDEVQQQLNQQLTSNTAPQAQTGHRSRSPKPAPARTVSRAVAYENINEAAKERTMSTIRRHAFTQARQPYSREEIDRIIDLVERYGTSWALIKTMDEKHPDGPELSLRGQVDIKDKCRNMVMDFYKARVRLPVNFNRVALKTRDREVLRQMGIEA